MIPRLSRTATLNADVDRFLKTLKQTDFSGEIRANFACSFICRLGGASRILENQSLGFYTIAA